MHVSSSDQILKDYLEHVPSTLKSDFEEVLSLMAIIAPDANLSFESGIPYFEQNHQELYGVAVRSGYLSLYLPNSPLLSLFADRLEQAHFGNGCLYFNTLAEINLNVLAELLGRVKTDQILRSRQRDVRLH